MQIDDVFTRRRELKDDNKSIRLSLTEIGKVIQQYTIAVHFGSKVLESKARDALSMQSRRYNKKN